MFKAKDQLLQCAKKNNEILFQYLDVKSVVNLSMCSKKYYLLVQPLLSVLSLDMNKSKTNKKTKESKKNNKNKGKQQQKLNKQKPLQVEVDVNRVSLSKSKQIILNGNWVRIYELPFNNSYLQGKLESGATFFYKNTDNNNLFFINRSLVDPNLNYNRGGFNQDLEDEMKTNMYAQMFEGDISQIDFTSPEALRIRHKQILEKIQNKKQQVAKMDIINYQQQLMKGISCKKIAIILCFGGSFSFGIFDQGKCILHKSDKKYVCRKKAGQRQLNKDKQSGTQIYSMGSQIRRDQQKKHIANVGQILNQNRAAIENCDLVFLQAPGLNRLFIINDSETLSGAQQKLRSACLTAKKANYTEVQAIYNQMTKVSFVKIKQNSQN